MSPTVAGPPETAVGPKPVPALFDPPDSCSLRVTSSREEICSVRDKDRSKSGRVVKYSLNSTNTFPMNECRDSLHLRRRQRCAACASLIGSTSCDPSPYCTRLLSTSSKRTSEDVGHGNKWRGAV